MVVIYIVRLLFALFILLIQMTQSSVLARCSDQFIKKEPKLASIYLNFFHKYKKCRFSSKAYLEYASRAVLAGRMREAYWAAKMGSRKPINLSQKARGIVLQSRALVGMGRNEEAIQRLKSLVTVNVAVKKDLRQWQERGHLMLIKAYYRRAGGKKDKNVRYLYNLFKNRYPQSRYSSWLRLWMKS